MWQGQKVHGQLNRMHLIICDAVRTLCMARALGVDSVTLYLPSYGAIWSGVEQSLRTWTHYLSLLVGSGELLPTSNFCSAKQTSDHALPCLMQGHRVVAAETFLQDAVPHKQHLKVQGLSPLEGDVLLERNPQLAVVRQAVLRDCVLDAACAGRQAQQFQ